MKIYRFRMQIEEGFRDMKSHQFGQGFEYNKTVKINRLSVLILLSTIAHWLLMAVGLATKHARKQYQANSLKNDTVLSLHFIGLRAIADKYSKLTTKQFLRAIEQLRISGGAYIINEL